MRLSCAGRAVEPAAQYAHHRLTLISLSKLSGEEKSWSDVCVHGTAGRAPPMAPVAFADKLESGVATTSSQNRINPAALRLPRPCVRARHRLLPARPNLGWR